MDVTHIPSAETEVLEHPVQESTVLLTKGVASAFDGTSVSASEVTFRAGERTKWHTHDGVQILYVTHGTGVVGTRDEERTVSEGDLIAFDPDEEHWHGNESGANAPFSHLSVIAQPEGAGPTVVE
ncbi:cupin domain-containing protein [Haloferax denitrificans]|uniref:Cupin 2 barrel domain-containing protein n=1 Tax=Haloferax denitrificans ATCC 35960 TaxID=662478 RepID=M0JBA2_9EURY|nr:cupin domain-containing protein [Haloferax denitrificans]EMA06377.1 cupin 2 barrel domain-containing protein [Haloferax denitrificans ATCC 35960]